MFYEHLKVFLDNAKSISSNTPFAETAASMEKVIPVEYSGLDVKVSFGKGNWARIPWIAFLAPGQKVQEGIYPVFLYYRSIDTLILSYGVSATRLPQLAWPLDSPKTIKEYFKENNIKAYNKYPQSFVYKVYSEGRIDESIDRDLDQLIKFYKDVMSVEQHNIESSTGMEDSKLDAVDKMSNVLSINNIIDVIKKTGLRYKDGFISRYVISLLTKPFVILSGLAGSGKTQLAIAFAKAICEDASKQIRVVSVGADWTNREPLLGYPNALDAGKYVHPESGVLKLIQDAIVDESRPYFLILDEMNLSYVERYFADFLSALESHSPILLWDKESDGVPMTIRLPRNLYIVGTINVDETTYMFSPKVLDRANVIEFKIDVDEMDLYLQNSSVIDIDKVTAELADMGEDFVSLTVTAVNSEYDSIRELLLEFFKALKSVNAEFGYRSASDIGRFVILAQKEGKLSLDEAVDAALVQKLLPKLHGSRKKLVPVLSKLWNMCEQGIGIELADGISEYTKYPLTADKILRMYRSAIDNGFTSFSEA